MVLFSTGSTQESKSPADTTKLIPVKFAFDITMLRETDMKDIRSALDLWMKMIGEKTGFKIETTMYDNINSLLQDYRKGSLDVLNLAPLSYLRLEKQFLNLEPLFVPVLGGKKTRKYLLIVRSDSALTDIHDLRGRKLAVMTTNEVGYIYLNILLLREKLGKAEFFFSDIIGKTKFSQAVLSVFFGQADACIATDIVLKTMIELNPQIGKRLKIISSSPEVANLVAFVRSDLDKQIKEAGLRELFNLENSDVGRQGLVLFGVERLVPLSESDLVTLRALFKEYNELSKKK